MRSATATATSPSRSTISTPSIARFESRRAQPQSRSRSSIRDGALMAKFFFVQDPDGYKIEVLQRHGRYR